MSASNLVALALLAAGSARAGRPVDLLLLPPTGRLATIHGRFDGLHTDPAELVGALELSAVGVGDTLAGIAARHGVSVRALARDNGLGGSVALLPGRRLRVDGRHLRPPALAVDGIVINVPQRMLYLVRAGELSLARPVRVGSMAAPTPLGSFVIGGREPGFRLAIAGAGITIEPAPAEGGGRGFATRGTVLLAAAAAAELHSRVMPQEAVLLIYEPVLLARLADGRILLEVHDDVYRLRASDPAAAARLLAEESALVPAIDWPAVRAVAATADGTPHEVGLPPD